MLFSEPKIPQSSAPLPAPASPNAFQCSSASRKFLNQIADELGWSSGTGFSALQRAENSSISMMSVTLLYDIGFSALQRAENSSILCSRLLTMCWRRFSALQRAENSSIPIVLTNASYVQQFQCSSASRKFLNADRAGASTLEDRVSVLFSEPKIPQFRRCPSSP